MNSPWVRRLLLLLLLPLLIMQAGCPDTWGKEGYVQKTLHKNLTQHDSRWLSCPLSQARWAEVCGQETERSGNCPEECPLPKDLEEG